MTSRTDRSIVVAGSLNMDFVVSVKHLPAPGETVLGHDFQMHPGGKGANQACAAGRLGAQVRMIGRVGNDVFGEQLKASLSAAGVDVSAVETTDQPTGVALIPVDARGQNCIVVAAGANEAITCADVPAMRAVFRDARIALLQLETPLDVVAAALAAARAEGLTTILDPAPAQALAPELLKHVDILTPNETEALILLDRPVARIELAQAQGIAAALREMGPRTVILKLGDQGCYVFADREQGHHPGFRVDAIDTTSAGDTFNAALAVALAEDQPLTRAVRFANAAAAISVTRRGAQASAPSRAEVDELLT